MNYFEREHVVSMEQTAARLAADCPVSGNFGNTQLEYFGFSKAESYNASWESYQGKRMIDIGTGVSDFVARLLAKGADAYGLDIGYGDLKRFSEDAPKRRDGWSANSFFLNSIKINPERYIACSAHDLPFENSSFDGVTSHFAVFGVVDLDRDLLQQSLNEAVRVLKTGGILKIGPFQGRQLSESQKTNQLSVIKELKLRDDIYVEAKHPRNQASRSIDRLGQLTIIKAA